MSLPPPLSQGRGASLIPVEVYLQIIDELVPDPKTPTPLAYRDLCACATTCRRWFAGARIKLYSYVWLEKLKHHLLFNRTILERPELGALVLELRTHVLLRPQSGWRNGSAALGRLTHLPLSPRTIERLVNIKALHFISDLSSLPNAILSYMNAFSACHTLLSLSIRKFSFMSFSHLRQLILSFRGLRSLQVCRCMWHPDRIMPPVGDDPLEALTAIDVSVLCSSYTYLLTCYSFSHTRASITWVS